MSTTRPAARQMFAVLALLVACIGAYHMLQATIALAGADGHAWQHLAIGVLYLLSAIGLLLRPRGFVLFFGLVTLYTVIAAVANLWKGGVDSVRLSIELATGFIVFPFALNLLTADTIHEMSPWSSH